MLVVEALGVTISIESGSADVATALEASWRSASVAPEADVLALPAPEGPKDAVLDEVSRLVTRAALEARSGSMLLLHAACCVVKATGECVVLVGASGAGKTTLVQVLARGGLYLTDEAVGIDSAGCVHPYPKPLSVLVSGRAHKVQTDPADLGLVVDLTQRPPVDRVLLLNRLSGAREPTIRPVRSSEAIVKLAAQSSQLRALPAPLRRLLDLVESVGGAEELTYAEAASVPPLMAGGEHAV